MDKTHDSHLRYIAHAEHLLVRWCTTSLHDFRSTELPDHKEMATNNIIPDTSAMRAVLETCELLERIPKWVRAFEDNARTLQVCRTWRTIMLGSKMLCQLLFLEPSCRRLRKDTPNPVRARIYLKVQNALYPLFRHTLVHNKAEKDKHGF